MERQICISLTYMSALNLHGFRRLTPACLDVTKPLSSTAHAAHAIAQQTLSSALLCLHYPLNLGTVAVLPLNEAL